MSYTLDTLLDQAAEGMATTAALRSTSVAVLFYALGFLDKKRFWLDTVNDPTDTISDDDWETIQELTAGTWTDLMDADVGKLFPFATQDPPPNTLECDGATYNRVDFPLLYAVLDANFIVDTDTFIVPDMQSRIIVGAGTGSGLSAYGVNASGGAESVTLSVSEIPSGLYTDPGHFHTESTAITSAILVGVGAPVPSALASVGVTGTSNANLVDNGGDGAHENRPPYRALRWCIQCQ